MLSFSPVRLVFIVEPAVAGGDVEHGVESGLEGEEGALHQLGGHLRVLAHLADLAQLQHRVDVERVAVQHALKFGPCSLSRFDSEFKANLQQ